MKVSIVMRSSWDGWVLRKIGLNLVSSLIELGVEAEYVNFPNPQSDVNHFLHFSFAEEVRGSKTTMMITHVDDAIKAKRVKTIVREKLIAGICMSDYHMNELIDYGIPKESLTYVLPALDNTIVRRIHFTIQCNRYRDGRKNEVFFRRLASSTNLSFAQFSFFGSGWEDIARDLRNSGAEVAIFLPTEDFEKDYREMVKALEVADFYLNLGWDEGSLASLDAFINRTPMILSGQGYHLNIPDSNSLFFNNYEQFQSIILRISDEYKEKQKTADSMTWLNYARKHELIWQNLLINGNVETPLNSHYTGQTLTFEKTNLHPILDRSVLKTFKRAIGIYLRKLRIVKS